MNKSLIYIAIMICGMALGIGIVSFFNKKSTTDNTPHEHVEPTIWTCSMHPEIRQDEPGICPICNMELTPLEQDTGSADTKMFKLNDRALALANIETYTINQGKENITNKSYTGRIEATDAAVKSQAAYVAGRIEKLYINTTGEMVQKGQVIARIYSPDFLSAQQELLSAYKRKESMPSLYQAVHNKLLQWKWSEKQIQNLIETQEIQSSFPILSMISGEVVAKKVSEGSYVTAGEELFEIADLQTVWGVLDVSEEQINQISLGDQVELLTSTHKQVAGKVDFIYPLVDSATRTVQVRIEISNPDRALKPGMLVRANIASSNLTDEQLYLPKSSVLWTGKRSVVYIVHKQDGESFFEMREVTLGKSSGDSYQVLAGIEALEEVVSHGTFTIDAAAQLQGRESMMDRKKSFDIEVSEAEQNKLLAFMSYYFNLKDSFVSSDAEAVALYAKQEIMPIQSLNINLDNKAQELWTNLIKQWDKIAKETEDISKQRLAFKELNDNLLPIAREIAIHQDTWHLQECPMADNNTGGQWLSLEKQIINPYFGESMLHCGSIEEIL